MTSRRWRERGTVAAEWSVFVEERRKEAVMSDSKKALGGNGVCVCVLCVCVCVCVHVY